MHYDHLHSPQYSKEQPNSSDSRAPKTNNTRIVVNNFPSKPTKPSPAPARPATSNGAAQTTITKAAAATSSPAVDSTTSTTTTPSASNNNSSVDAAADEPPEAAELRRKLDEAVKQHDFTACIKLRTQLRALGVTI